MTADILLLVTGICWNLWYVTSSEYKAQRGILCICAIICAIILGARVEHDRCYQMIKRLEQKLEVRQ